MIVQLLKHRVDLVAHSAPQNAAAVPRGCAIRTVAGIRPAPATHAAQPSAKDQCACWRLRPPPCLYIAAEEPGALFLPLEDLLTTQHALRTPRPARPALSLQLQLHRTPTAHAAGRAPPSRPRGPSVDSQSERIEPSCLNRVNAEFAHSKYSEIICN